MTPYDLVLPAVFGLLFLGARRLDRMQRDQLFESLCKTSSSSPSSSGSSSSPRSTFEDASGFGPMKLSEAEMPDHIHYHRGLP